MNPTVQWPDQTLPVSISCAPGVLTSLEILATDGLLAMPRIGLGIGGLLLGQREEGRIDIHRSVEVACSHALGPSFILTPAEMKALVALPESEEEPSQVVGWYCSKPQGALTPTEHDHVLFDAFCPEAWQTLLLIHPAKGHPTRASFGFREVRQYTCGEWLDLAWQELAGFEEPAPPPPPVIPVIAVVPVEEPTVIPVAMPNIGTLFGNPGPAHQAPAPPKRPKKKQPERPWKVNLVFAGIVLMILAMIALLARGLFGS